jgi:ParB family transcriptional regulator, chromosome partitioning protein
VGRKSRGTAIAESHTALLKIATAGNEQRAVAEAAQQAGELAEAQEDIQEAERQVKLLTEAKNKQKELQTLAYKSAVAEKEAKLLLKKSQCQPFTPGTKVKVGEEWMLGRHLVYCGDTAQPEFMDLRPSDAALAIATVSTTWNHNYLIGEARVVAVLRSPGQIYEFYKRNQMPFQYELVLGNIYVGIFSHQSLSQPQTAINIEV